MVHNPLIKTFNGKYYLYYISGKDPGIQPIGSTGEHLNKRNRVQQEQKIGVIEFASVEELLNGRFIRSDKPLLSPRTRVKINDVIDPSPVGTIAKPDNLIVTNPAVVYRPSDKKYLLYFKGNIYDPQWRGVHGVAIGDSPIGPFTTTDDFVFDVMDNQGKKVSAEDPYVWYHRHDQRFYAVVKDFNGKLTGSEPGLALMQSNDGIKWIPAASPLFMKKELILKNGTAAERKALLQRNLGVDVAQVHVFGNEYVRVAHRGVYRCGASYGAKRRGGEGSYDIGDLFNAEPVVENAAQALEYFGRGQP